VLILFRHFVILQGLGKLKSNLPHQSRKILEADFSSLWDRIYAVGETYLVTPNGHKFTAEATTAVRGIHGKQKLLRIKQKGREFARIYECCWGHTTNCYGTRIGGYSESLNSWYKGLIISLDSLTLKPKNEVIHDFGTLLGSPLQSYQLAISNVSPLPGIYLVYDRRQKKYIYADSAEDMQKRIQEEVRLQKSNSRLKAQTIQKGLIESKRCTTSAEAKKYILTNCEIRILGIPDEKGRKYPWIRRSLLAHYAISVLEPDFNISTD